MYLFDMGVQVYYGVFVRAYYGYRRTNLQIQAFYIFAMGVVTYTYVCMYLCTGIIR